MSGGTPPAPPQPTGRNAGGPASRPAGSLADASPFFALRWTPSALPLTPPTQTVQPDPDASGPPATIQATPQLHVPTRVLGINRRPQLLRSHPRITALDIRPLQTTQPAKPRAERERPVVQPGPVEVNHKRGGPGPVADEQVSQIQIPMLDAAFVHPSHDRQSRAELFRRQRATCGETCAQVGGVELFDGQPGAVQPRAGALDQQGQWGCSRHPATCGLQRDSKIVQQALATGVPVAPQ